MTCPCPPGTLHQVQNDAIRCPGRPIQLYTPSEHELDLLAALADGHTPQQIATQAGIGHSAISMQLHRLRQRAGASTTGHLIATAIRNRWIA